MDRGVGLRGLETIDLEPVVIEMSRAPRRRSAPSEVLVEMARLKGLSDSVVAFALTLLVLDIRLPPGVTTADLPGSVFAMGPAMLVYLLSFAIIGGAWGSHQRMLGQISRGDGLLVWFNLLSLLPVTLLPACASLLGDFPNQDISIAVFALDALAIQLTAFLLWRHASRHGLVHRSLDPRVVDGIGRR
ncbi:MAG TPA: TMEM175 family protein, partial [Candidatus Dormibacteraeota bacterium]|nr:TMEM175 family protein [Candidatus Dormibacteraeota bacterium]